MNQDLVLIGALSAGTIFIGKLAMDRSRPGSLLSVGHEEAQHESRPRDPKDPVHRPAAGQSSSLPGAPRKHAGSRMSPNGSVSKNVDPLHSPTAEALDRAHTIIPDPQPSKTHDTVHLSRASDRSIRQARGVANAKALEMGRPSPFMPTGPGIWTQHARKKSSHPHQTRHVFTDGQLASRDDLKFTHQQSPLKHTQGTPIYSHAKLGQEWGMRGGGMHSVF